MTKGNELDSRQQYNSSVRREQSPFIPTEVREVARIMADSLGIGENDKVFIKYNFGGKPLVDEVNLLALERKAEVRYMIDNPAKTAGILKSFDENTPQEEFDKLAEVEINGIDWADKVILITLNDNPDAMKDVGAYAMDQWRRARTPARKLVDDKKEWMITFLPSRQEAEAAEMVYGDYVRMYLNACRRDWNQVREVQKLLIEEVLDPAKEIEILAGRTEDGTYRTHLRVGKKGECTNSTIKHNMPGSEVSMIPAENGLNGRLVIADPLRFEERMIEDLALEFKDGKLISYATSNADDMQFLAGLFGQDQVDCEAEEFSLGTNGRIKWVKRPSPNPLLREKAAGTCHLGLKIKPNGKDYAMHIDVVIEMNPRFGGGMMLVNGQEVQGDGSFKDERYSILNPR